MPNSPRSFLDGTLFLTVAGVLGFLAVAAGAIGAHALKAHLTPDDMALFRTGWEYHLLHALGLSVIGALALSFPKNQGLRYAGVFWIVGMVLFSGSLYAVSLGAPRELVHITPLGGFSLMAGWIALTVGARSIRKA